jgi:hypothetical protein
VSSEFVPAGEVVQTMRRNVMAWLELYSDRDAQLAWAKGYHARPEHDVMVSTALKNDYLADFDFEGWGLHSHPCVTDEEFSVLLEFTVFFRRRLPVLADSWAELQSQPEWVEILNKAGEIRQRLGWTSPSESQF